MLESGQVCNIIFKLSDEEIHEAAHLLSFNMNGVKFNWENNLIPQSRLISGDSGYNIVVYPLPRVVVSINKTSLEKSTDVTKNKASIELDLLGGYNYSDNVIVNSKLLTGNNADTLNFSQNSCTLSNQNPKCIIVASSNLASSNHGFVNVELKSALLNESYIFAVNKWGYAGSQNNFDGSYFSGFSLARDSFNNIYMATGSYNCSTGSPDCNKVSYLDKIANQWIDLGLFSREYLGSSVQTPVSIASSNQDFSPIVAYAEMNYDGHSGAEYFLAVSSYNNTSKQWSSIHKLSQHSPNSISNVYNSVAKLNNIVYLDSIMIESYHNTLESGGEINLLRFTSNSSHVTSVLNQGKKYSYISNAVLDNNGKIILYAVESGSNCGKLYIQDAMVSNTLTPLSSNCTVARDGLKLYSANLVYDKNSSVVYTDLVMINLFGSDAQHVIIKNGLLDNSESTLLSVKGSGPSQAYSAIALDEKTGVLYVIARDNVSSMGYIPNVGWQELHVPTQFGRDSLYLGIGLYDPENDSIYFPERVNGQKRIYDVIKFN